MAERGIGNPQIAAILNTRRNTKNLSNISVSVVDKFVTNSPGTIVKDEGLRHGRRAMNHKGNEQLTTL